MIEIEADFGTTVRDGMIRAYRSEAPASLEVGDVVRAVDRDEDLSYTGTVYDIEGPFIYLLMHWRNRRGVVCAPGGAWFSVGTDSGATGGTGRPDDNQTVTVQFPVELPAAV